MRLPAGSKFILPERNLAMLRYTRKIAAFIMSALILLSLGGCGSDSGDDSVEPMPTGEGGVPLREMAVADDKFTLNYSPGEGFHPITSKSTDNLLFMPLIYESLFNVDETMECTPNLCTGYEINPDNEVTYTFKIDTSRMFHDGTLLTAKDVERSIIAARVSTLYGDRLNQNIAGISSIGDEELVITLYKPNTQFPALLNIPIYKHESRDEDFPEGTGPYMLDEARTKLIRFDSHPDFKKLPIATIHLREFATSDEIISAFENKELDLVINDPAGMRNLGYGNPIKHYYQTTAMHYLGFNMESDFLYLAAHRSAVGYAVNRSGIVTNIMGGSGTEAALPLLPVSKLYNQNYAAALEFSPEKSKSILDAQAIKDNDGDGFRDIKKSDDEIEEIVINFIVNNENSTKVGAARDIVKNLNNIGLDVNLRELSWADFQQALQSKDFDMYYGEIKLTADFDLTRLLTRKGLLNYGGITDESYGMKIDDYLKSPEETRQMYADAMYKYIGDTAPVIPIAFHKKQVLTHRDVVFEMEPTQYNIFNKFTNWVIDITADSGTVIVTETPEEDR